MMAHLNNMNFRIPDFIPEDEDAFDFKEDDQFDEADFDDPVKAEKLEGSPTGSNPSSSLLNGAGGNAKRPTRKSTLTQQQKNQKRQRATQEQLGTLEVEFNKNPTPNASVRDRIAQQINMTERSVQIWFQNRRAKIKNLAKRSIENGEDCEAIPESMRRYLHMQAIESGNPEYMLSRGLAPYPGGMMINAESNGNKVMICHLHCSSLTVGSWRRVRQTQLDLVIFYSPAKAMVTYYIQAENTGFRIEYPFSSIKSVTLVGGDKTSEAEGASDDSGFIAVELTRAPLFTMDQGCSGWFQCRDFTEDHQASKVMVHNIGGHAKILGSHLSKLTSLDTFRNRFGAELGKPALNTPPVQMPIQMPLSVPLPVPLERPSSQPNHNSMLPPSSAVFHDPTFHMGPPPPRGHKRQRSRSVPTILDFNPRRQPVPPFLVQHHHVHHHQTVHNISNSQNQIFAPIPQYAPHPIPAYQPPPNPNPFGSVGPPLQVDPSAGFNFDFNTPAPPSATTGTTPPSSEFEHSLYVPSFQYEAYSAPQPQGPFTGAGFLSPIIDSPQDDPNSPLAGMGPGHHLSPTSISPHNPLFRSASADPRFHHLSPTDGLYNDYIPFNTDNFVMGGKMNGFDEAAKFEAEFSSGGSWHIPEPAPEANSADAPVNGIAGVDGGASKNGGNSKNRHTKNQLSLVLPFRSSIPEPPRGSLPPATPPPPDDYEFSELVNMTP